MKTIKSIFVLAFFTVLVGLSPTKQFAQSSGQTYKSNITLKSVTDFGNKIEGRDVWGWKAPNGTHYALIMINRGLSIVNTTNTSSPLEIVHINHPDYNNSDPTQREYLDVVDVETFKSGSTTYAYLSVHDKDAEYFVLIINLNQAITQSGNYGIDPDGSLNSVFVGRIENPVKLSASNPASIAWQAHTLTITGGYLYVATLKDKIPVWNLNSSATSPTYKGAITVTPSNSEVHEMYVKKVTSTSSKIYAACLRGGLQVIDLNLNNMSKTQTSQTYDSDKKYANKVNSTDALFDFRFTHSA